MNKEFLLDEMHDFLDNAIEERFFEDEIFGPYADSDITIANFLKWCEMSKDFYLDDPELSKDEREEIISDYEDIRLLAKYNETWNRVTDIFYGHWIISNALVLPTLINTINLDHHSFLILFEKAIKSELKTYEDHEEREINHSFLNRLNNLLLDKNVFIRVKRTYLRRLFGGPLLGNATSRIKKLNSHDLIKSLSSVIEETQPELLGNMTKGEILNIAYQITQPDNLEYYAKYLAAEEQKGYIAFRTYCQVIKEVTFNHIKHIISIKKFIKTQVYPNSYEGFQDLLQSFEYLAPNEIIKLYYPNHKYSLECISQLISSCLIALLTETDDNLDKILLETKEKSREYFDKNGDILFDNLCEHFLVPRFNKLDLLVNKMLNTFENYSNDRKKDGLRSIVGGLTGTGLFSMFKITKRELTIHSKVQNDFDNILTFYNDYLNDLEVYEDFLIQHYEKFFDRWFELHIEPLAKSIFKKFHPVRKSIGLNCYEEFLAQEILEVKDLFEELTPVVNLEYKPYLDSKAFKTYSYTKA